MFMRLDVELRAVEWGWIRRRPSKNGPGLVDRHNREVGLTATLIPKAFHDHIYGLLLVADGHAERQKKNTVFRRRTKSA